LSGQPVYRKLTGTRIIVAFSVDSIDDATEFQIGLNASKTSPLSDGENVVAASFVSQDNEITLRGHLGSSTSSVGTGLTVTSFTSKDWILEIEFIDEQSIQVRLLDFDDLETVQNSWKVNVENTNLGKTSPVMKYWTVSTLADGDSVPGASVSGHIDYVDVEPGINEVFSLGSGTVTSGNVKARPLKNQMNIPLTGENGWLSINTAAGFEASSLTSTHSDSIFFDNDDVEVVVDSIGISGGVEKELKNPRRIVKKFSQKTGFKDITVIFRASRRGNWFVVIDGDNPSTDLVVARGEYDIAGSSQTVTFDGNIFSELADGSHVINVVVCKNPVPTSVMTATGVATMTARAVVT